MSTIDTGALEAALRQLGLFDADHLDRGRLFRRAREIIAEIGVAEPGRDLIKKALRTAALEQLSFPQPAPRAAEGISYVRTAAGTVATRNGERVLRVGGRELTVSEAREDAALAELSAMPRGEERIDPQMAPQLLRGRLIDHRAQRALVAQGIGEPTYDQYAAALLEAEARVVREEEER